MKPLNPFGGSPEVTQTAIIPVDYNSLQRTYTIKVHEELWNYFQVALITGASEKNTVIRFDIHDGGGGA